MEDDDRPDACDSLRGESSECDASTEIDSAERKSSGSDDESHEAGPESTDSADSQRTEEDGEEVEPKAPKDNWDKLKALSPLLTAIVVAVLGYSLTGSVNQYVQKSQLQLNYLKEMRDLLVDMRTKPESATDTAVVLAAYGSFSIAPLLNEFQVASLTLPEAAETGLTLVALSEPVVACPAMGRVLDNQTAAYTWQAQRAALHVIGKANCQSERPILKQYSARLKEAASNVSAFAATVSNSKEVRIDAIERLLRDSEDAQKLLTQGKIK